MNKVIILIIALFLSIESRADSGVQCKDEQYIKLDSPGSKIEIYREAFIRDNRCIIGAISYLLHERGDKKIQRINGIKEIVTGIRNFYIGERRLLKLDTIAGAHTHYTYIFWYKPVGYDKKGLELYELITIGIFGGDYGEPIVYVDGIHKTIKITTRDIIRNPKKSTITTEYRYLYNANKFTKNKDEKDIVTSAQDMDTRYGY